MSDKPPNSPDKDPEGQERNANLSEEDRRFLESDLAKDVLASPQFQRILENQKRAADIAKAAVWGRETQPDKDDKAAPGARGDPKPAGTRVIGQTASESAEERRVREQQQIVAEVVATMYATHREKYNDPNTPEDQREAIFQIYKDKLEERKHREGEEFRRRLARIVEAQDLLQRIKGDPEKAHIPLPAEDSEEELLKWREDMSKPGHRPDYGTPPTDTESRLSKTITSIKTGKARMEEMERVRKRVEEINDLGKALRPSGTAKPNSPITVEPGSILDGIATIGKFMVDTFAKAPVKTTPKEEMDNSSREQSNLVGAEESETVQSPAMDQFFDDIAEKKGQLRARAESFGMAASDVFAWCWGEWNRFAFVAGGFLVGGGVALSVSAYLAAEILFAIGVALFVAKGIHDLWSKKHRKEIAVILCILGIGVIFGQVVLIEWNRPRQQEGLIERPVSSTVPKALPRFDKFMSEPRRVHDGGYLIYKVAHPADLSPVEFYVRLGTLGGEEMRVVAYVVSPYQREQVMTIIARNYETILEHLRGQAKENGFLEISVSRTVILHVDLGGNQPISFPKEAREKGIHFEIERRMFE